MNAAEVETASWARRVGALVVDWIACTLAVSLFTPVLGDPGGAGGFYVFGAYLIEATLLVSLAGGSFGQIATRLRVVSVFPGTRRIAPVPLLRSLVRHALVLLVIPPLVYRPDGRGLHDMIGGTATLTIQEFQALSGRRAT